MDVLDHRVGSDDEAVVPPRFDHRGIVARPNQDLGSRPGETRKDARQQGMFAQLRYRHQKVSRLAVWGGLLNLHQQVEPL